MHRQRLFGIITATITLLGVLLPWATGAPVVLRSAGTSYLEAWIILFLLGFTLFLYFSGDDTQAPKALANYAGILSGAIAVIIAIVMIFGFKSRIQEMETLYAGCTGWSKDIHYGFGLYLVIIGGICQILAALLFRNTDLPSTKTS